MTLNGRPSVPLQLLPIFLHLLQYLHVVEFLKFRALRHGSAVFELDGLAGFERFVVKGEVGVVEAA